MTILYHNLKQFLISLDQFLTTLISVIVVPHRLAYADLTFSAQCWMYHLQGTDWPYKLVDTIMFFDKNHCEESYKSEVERLHLPMEFRIQPKKE